MFLNVFVLCFVALPTCFGDIPFMYQDLHNSSMEVVHVNSASISPHPIKVPGNLTVNVQAEIKRHVNGSYNLNVVFHEWQNLNKTWAKLPCIQLLGVGSCDYDLCDLLARHFIHENKTQCPQQLVDQNLPCTCPFQPGTFTMKSAVFAIPRLDPLWGILFPGDFKVDAKLTEMSTGKEVANYHVEFSVHVLPCKDGLSCLFG